MAWYQVVRWRKPSGRSQQKRRLTLGYVVARNLIAARYKAESKFIASARFAKRYTLQLIEVPWVLVKCVSIEEITDDQR